MSNLAINSSLDFTTPAPTVPYTHIVSVFRSLSKIRFLNVNSSVSTLSSVQFQLAGMHTNITVQYSNIVVNVSNSLAKASLFGNNILKIYVNQSTCTQSANATVWVYGLALTSFNITILNSTLNLFSGSSTQAAGLIGTS